MVTAGIIDTLVSARRSGKSITEGTEAVANSWVNRDKEEWNELYGRKK